MLPARAAEAVERVASDIAALLDADLLDGAGHVFDCDAEKPLGRLFRACGCAAGLFGGSRGKLLEHSAHCLRVERLVGRRPEHLRKVFRLKLSEQDVAVGDRERPAASIARGTGIGARAFGTDLEPAVLETQDRASSSRHRIDPHHRRSDPHSGHFGFQCSLEAARIVTDVSRRSAHIEPDELVVPCVLAGLRHAHDAACGAGKNRVLSPE